MEDHGSRNIDVEALERSMEAKLCRDSPVSAKCCIFRVPELLRRHKLEAYQPDVVSIGPLHHHSGIEFRRGSVDGLMNIDFKDGVLTIPQLPIAEMTEPLFRNLIAFEQCHHGRENKVTSYALLLANLIASSKDVVFLCDKQIIHNWLSAEDVSQLFGKLHSDTYTVGFCYGGLCAEVNKYYQATWNKWLAGLKRDYLSNPWKITSLVVAFILMVLTLLQTTYTIQQYYHPRQ
ncbi:hypothetical protein ACLB2K_041205 [Fragaria x ananassa]